MKQKYVIIFTSIKGETGRSDNYPREDYTLAQAQRICLAAGPAFKYRPA